MKLSKDQNLNYLKINEQINLELPLNMVKKYLAIYVKDMLIQLEKLKILKK